MKSITEETLASLVSVIVKEKGNLESGEMVAEIIKRVGDNWMVKHEPPMRFTKNDINAVANARFYRKTGQSLIMVVIIIILAIAATVRYIPSMTTLYYNIAYTLCGIVGLGFIWIYTKKQSKARRELWQQLGRDEKAEDK